MKIKLALVLNRKVILLGLLIMAFVLIPTDIAHAGLLETFTNAITGAVAGILAVAFGIIAGLVATIFLTISSIFFEIINYFINSTVVPNQGNTPSFVGTSFNFVLQLVNMFFILILVFIGLATILRIQSYEIKKILPKLIIIALLVNFSALFVGFIVDISNLIAHYFLQLAKGDWGDVIKAVWPEGSTEQKLGTQIASIIYFLVAILIYLVLIILFAVRTMFLWLIVILAPLAFASYILPATKKKIWDPWLSQLLQWSFFVIPVTFFMFLAQATLTGGENIVSSDNLDSGIDFLRKFLAPFTAIFMLYIGITVSQQSAPAAAKGVMKLAGKAGLITGRRTLGRFLASKTGGKLSAGLARANMGVMSSPGEEWKAAKGLGKLKVAAKIATAPGLLTARWATQQTGKRALEYGAAQGKGIDKEIANLEGTFGKDYKRAAAIYGSIGITDYQGKAAMALYLAKTKGRQGLSELDDDQLQDATKIVAQYQPGRLEDIIKHRPDLAQDDKIGTAVQDVLISDGLTTEPSGEYKDKYVQALSESGIEEKELLEQAAYDKAVDAMSNVDLDNADKALMNDGRFRQAVARWRPWSFIRKIGEEWGGDMIDRLQDEAQKIPGGLESLAITNPSFIRAAYTPQGRMFMNNWMHNGKELKEEDARTLIENARKKGPGSSSTGRPRGTARPKPPGAGPAQPGGGTSSGTKARPKPPSAGPAQPGGGTSSGTRRPSNRQRSSTQSSDEPDSNDDEDGPLTSNVPRDTGPKKGGPGPKGQGGEKSASIVDMSDKEFQKWLKEEIVTFEDSETLSKAAGTAKNNQTSIRLYERMIDVGEILTTKPDDPPTSNAPQGTGPKKGGEGPPSR